MSRIINKLVAASGGWETFLYTTLKDLCTAGLYAPQLIQTESKLKELLEEAQEILEAYAELDRLPEKARKTPVFEGDPDDEDVSDRKVRVTPVIKTMKTESVVVPAEDVEWKLEDLVLTLPPRPAPNSRREKARVFVDKDLGGSSGELPVPANHKLVKRQALIITTHEGMGIGEASAKQGEEGQIKSQYVTGHISATGKYKLVFTDTTLGAALIHYDVVALPSKIPSKQYKIALAAANKMSVDDLSERLKHFGFVIEKCLCGKAECFGWRVIDQAEKVEAGATSKDPVAIQARLQHGLNLEAQRAEKMGVAEAMNRNVSIQDLGPV